MKDSSWWCLNHVLSLGIILPPRVQKLVLVTVNKSQLWQRFVAFQSPTLSNRVLLFSMHFSRVSYETPWFNEDRQTVCEISAPNLRWLDGALEDFPSIFGLISEAYCERAPLLTYQLPLAVWGCSSWLSLRVTWFWTIKCKQFIFYYLVLLKLFKSAIIMSKVNQKRVDNIDEYLPTTKIKNYFLIWNKIKS